MNSLQNTLAASSLAILAGTSQAAPQDTPIIDILGVKENTSTIYFNKATQALIAMKCESKTPDTATCKVEVRDNQTFGSFDQTYDFAKTAQGLTVSVTPGAAHNWPKNIQNTDFKQKMGMAAKSEWTAQMPLAKTVMGSNNGSNESMIVQNDVKLVEKKDDTVSLLSSVPIGPNFGIKISNVFDRATNSVQTFAIPQVAFGGAVVTAEAMAGATRDMSRTNGDDTIFDDNFKIAGKGGGTSFAKKVLVSGP